MIGIPTLKAGDVFCTRNNTFLGKLINISQKLDSPDNESVYTHAGIVTSPFGKTFEAKATLNDYHLNNYIGERVLIVRPKLKRDKQEIEVGAQLAAINILRHMYKGHVYPAWRLVLHAVPYLSKYVTAKGRFVVCSELVAKYLYLIGARHEQYTGTSPDDLADEFLNYWNYEVIFEGLYKA